jgi:hypothetical protein
VPCRYFVRSGRLVPIKAGRHPYVIHIDIYQTRFQSGQNTLWTENTICAELLLSEDGGLVLPPHTAARKLPDATEHFAVHSDTRDSCLPPAWGQVMAQVLPSQSGLLLRGLAGASGRVRQWAIVRGGDFCGSRQ